MQTTRHSEDVSLFPVLLLAGAQAHVGASVEKDEMGIYALGLQVGHRGSGGRNRMCLLRLH